MSKKYRNFSNFKQESEDKNIVTESNKVEVTEENIENENNENDTLLIDRSEIETVLKNNVEETIEKNSDELKEKIESIHSSLVPKEVKEEFTVDMKDYVSTTLLSYYESVNASKIVNNDDIARWNYSLYNLFIEILNKPLEEFKKDWKTVLKFFDQYSKDCFNHGLLYRAPFSWPGTDKEFEIYKTLAFLCVETAKPETRTQAIKELRNLESKLSFLTEDQKSKIISFYF